MRNNTVLTLIIILSCSLLFAQQPQEKLKSWAAEQTEDINADDVVNFLNESRAEGDITFGYEYVFNYGRSLYISATSLDATHFVVAYRDRHIDFKEYGTAIVGTVSGSNITYGTELIFNVGEINHISTIRLDSTRFVVAYEDVYSTGTAIVGNLSGSNISFGPEFYFNWDCIDISATYLDTIHFVVTSSQYADNSRSSTARVGTVSGNNISFGPEFDFSNGSAASISATNIDATHFVVTYSQYADNSWSGTARVGTVSGNNISFGPEYVFNAGLTAYCSTTTLDATRFVVAYQDYDNSSYGTTTVGTVSGSQISFGARIVFNHEISYIPSVISLDSTHIVVAYRDGGNSNYGTVILGEVAGNNISFGPEFVFNSSLTGSTGDGISAIRLDSTDFIVAYEDVGNSEYGTAIVGEVESPNEVTWTGIVGSDWNTNANWDGYILPNSTDNVTIPDVTYQPVIPATDAGECNKLRIEEGASLTIQSLASGTGTLITHGPITNNGTVNIERYISWGAWHLISSPMANVTAGTFSGNYLQNYDSVWSFITDPSTPLIPVKGYSLWEIAGGPSTFIFTGDPNTGDQSLEITSANDGWNLLGNPYPSPIDWDDLDDTYGAVYYYVSELWNYVTWNDGTGSGSRYVPAMQGFFIKTASDVTFNLSDENRTHSGHETYYKNQEDILSNHVELQVDGNDYYDQLFISFDNEATEDFDLQYDAYKLFSPEGKVPQLYSFTGEDVLSIDRRPEGDVIQLGFKCGENGNYTIKLNELTDISALILEDTKTGVMHNLQNGSYDFNYVITDDEKRFKLYFKATGISKLTDDLLKIYSSNKAIYIRSNDIINDGTIRVTDVLGRTLLEQKFTNSNYEKIPAGFETGIYIVTIEHDAKFSSKKIFIN